jgi:thiamine biosynthesis lipoprotein
MTDSEKPAFGRAARPLSRRRAIAVFAAAAGMPFLVSAGISRLRREAPVAAELSRGLLYREGMLTRWQGAAMGADAEINLYHPDADAARAIVAACLSEVERLERVFSLFREDSELCRLNRSGGLGAPSGDMRRLLALSREISVRSGGAFDPTVQPLWSLYAGHFAKFPDDEAGPDPDAVAQARSRVDYRKIHIRPDGIALEPGTEITLNGIAQGYITDRVADVMRAMGVENVLLDLGETRALGTRPEGAPWRIGLPDPASPPLIARRLDLANRAVATSGGYGTRFDRAGRFHHLFDPAQGRSAQYYAAVSVAADRAVLADALSTALYALPFDAAERLVRSLEGVAAYFTLDGGRTISV